MIRSFAFYIMLHMNNFTSLPHYIILHMNNLTSLISSFDYINYHKTHGLNMETNSISAKIVSILFLFFETQPARDRLFEKPAVYHMPRTL